MLRKYIYDSAADIVIHGDSSPYKQLSSWINRIDNDYFENVQRDCEEISADLDFSLQDRVLSDLQKEIASLLSEDLKKKIIAKVAEKDVSKFSQEEKKQAYKYVTDLAHKRLEFLPAVPYSAEELKNMLEEARRRTLNERIFTSNKNDIIKFHHALLDNTVWNARYLVEKRIASFITETAASILSNS